MRSASPTAPRQLLLQGSDEKYPLHLILDRNGVHHVQPLAHEGMASLLTALPVRVKGSEVHCLGVVIDAGADPASSWEAIASLLRPLGYEVPSEAPESGAVLESESRPRVGVWVMPDNVSAGAFDDFLLALIPAGNALLQYSIEVVDKAPVAPGRLRSKAILHVWLALQVEPGTTVSVALGAYAVDLDLHADLALRFVAWAARLFEDCTDE